MADFGISETAILYGTLAATVAAAGASAYVQYETSQAQAAELRNEAKNEELQGEQAANAARAAEEQSRNRTRRILAQQRALVSGSGLGEGEAGSALAVLMDSQEQASLEALTLRHQGEVAQYGRGLTATALRNRAADVTTAGYWGAGTTLLTGLASAGSVLVKTPSGTIPRTPRSPGGGNVPPAYGTGGPD